MQLSDSLGATYATCYQDSYKSKAKSQNTTYACIGWVIGAGISLAILANSSNDLE